jgi:group II intron reverse transcriptase/maturase
MSSTKPFSISKQLVWQAYQAVRKNKGAGGIDGQSLEDFDKNRDRNLYKIWNRMSSGTYFPPKIRNVSIPKKDGGIRVLGIPTVSDRIAQTVVKMRFEPILEPLFYCDSCGYRPEKSALDAIKTTRKRCWRKDWVLEFDIKGMFDNIDHDLMMKAVKHHSQDKWVTLYIQRWLDVLVTENGERKGTPQGGVVSPLLANLFMHYAFDHWISKNYPRAWWCRYADDGLVHCNTLAEAKEILKSLKVRFNHCGLDIHPTKTRIVYCKDADRKGTYEHFSFDFLGFTFRARGAKNRYGHMFTSFLPAISKSALKAISTKLRRTDLRCRVDLGLEGLAYLLNPFLRGWRNYYGAFYPSALYPLWRRVNNLLIKWAMNKYRKLKRRRTRACRFIESLSLKRKNLFVHWQAGTRGSFA